MTGILAQVISLTSYGNEYLHTGKLSSDFYLTNSTFQFCNTVDFRDFKEASTFFKKREKIVANNPYDWLHWLKSKNCKKISLIYQYSVDPKLKPEHELAGMVGGGGDWIIQTIHDDYANYWWNYWTAGNQNAKDRKIWSVKYIKSHKKQIISRVQIDISKQRSLLQASLQEVTEFAYSKNLTSWGDVFRKSQDVLTEELPGHAYYHQDLIVRENYSLDARQLLFAAAAAFVFGGMGSWNDMWFEKQEDNQKYNDISARLYHEINRSIMVAINSF
ncbi:MAG: hypothetical protein JST75_12600 [Bacteroidetes bacterium]|nr:hypothetical protein [Bacteroidota bacterium]